ncbi:MAG: PilZ domain-containing protein [Planctomycetota bacterium]
MRRHVRYSPLGRTRKVRLCHGMDMRVRDAEVIDESRHGFGLKLPDAAGLEVGQKVHVENHKGKFPATIVRIELTKDGNVHLGLEFPQNNW